MAQPARKTHRKYKELPIIVVEYHHEVIPFIYKAIGAKYLPLEGNVMIHFDSHPDLLIPSDMKAETVYEKYNLFDHLSIENWIMPAVYAGHFNKICWVRPPWCNQIKEGLHSFHIGEEKSSNCIRVTCPEPYFVSEALYANMNDLMNVREVDLEVFTLGRVIEENGSDSFTEVGKVVQKYINQDQTFILDIDLDFFSTRNPFLSLYEKADLYNRLKELYQFPKDIADVSVLTAERKQQIATLQRFFSHLSRYDHLDDLSADLSSSPYLPQVKSIHSEILKQYPQTKIDWEMVHDAGCTCDESGLPEHVTSREDVTRMIDVSLSGFLSLLPRPPSMITISRSSFDNYCPPEDVDFIQGSVLKVLTEKYTTVKVVLDYEDRYYTETLPSHVVPGPPSTE